ncbi:cellulose synthase-like protein G3 isoform X2 [Corylus avellana]|uniref:cellulose synthase-like protein G3 isoform X2 n=1 Tax=Corylus avellana TaxID=13451 RepID=UPI00286CD07B|nr:cellulose synthase-like protein G3 isoform X2 [Corylus avellana]
MEEQRVRSSSSSSISSSPPLHTLRHARRTAFNRAFAAVYTCAISALLYYHALKLIHSTTLSSSFFISLSFFLSDAILAFMWASRQCFLMTIVYRDEYPENLERVLKKPDFPALDVFICTADPYKEPPMRLISTVLAVMAYEYPTEKISIYVSDDGGSELTLFACMEAAKFATHWLPFCRKKNMINRSPEVYFASNHSWCSETEKIKILYESMKARVENVLDRGKVGEEYVNEELQSRAFSKWTEESFTRQDHPTVIQILLESSKSKDTTGHLMPNLIYVSREKRRTSPHNFKAGALNVLMGFRYGSLSEDFYTGFRLQCEGWRSTFCNPKRPAFLGDAPISLIDALQQCQRWMIGGLQVAFCKFRPITFGVRSVGPLVGLAYTNYSFWSFWFVPLTVYAFLPQLAHLNGLTIFPKLSEPWFFLYVFLFLGAYGQDLFEFVIEGGTVQKWWNNQRMWMIRGLSSFMFGFLEFFLTRLGISTYGFGLTSKVVDDEQSKRYDQGKFEFGVSSPMFMPLTMAAIINLVSFFMGLMQVIRGSSSVEGLFLQMFIAGFVVLNSLPIYEAMVLRRDKGRMHFKTTIISTLLALLLIFRAWPYLVSLLAISTFLALK